jgi:hypothetical protein
MTISRKLLAGVAAAALLLAPLPALAQAGGTTPSGSGGVGCTVSGTANQIAANNGSSGCISSAATANGAGTITIPAGQTLAAPANGITLQGSSTGITTFGSANAGASNFTATLPANTGTLVELNLGQTWTANQTFSGATFTPDTVKGIVGTTLADNAQAGSVGEFASSNIAVGSAVALSNNVVTNVTNISLTAGDWDCYGNTGFHGTSTTINYFSGAISTATASLGTFPNGGALYAINGLSSSISSGDFLMIAGQLRVNVSGSQTVYLVVQSGFGSGTVNAYGFLGCRRRR